MHATDLAGAFCLVCVDRYFLSFSFSYAGMGPVLVMSNTIVVNFATFSLLKSTIENAYMSYLVFFRTEIQRRIRI